MVTGNLGNSLRVQSIRRLPCNSNSMRTKRRRKANFIKKKKKKGEKNNDTIFRERKLQKFFFSIDFNEYFKRKIKREDRMSI